MLTRHRKGTAVRLALPVGLRRAGTRGIVVRAYRGHGEGYAYRLLLDGGTVDVFRDEVQP